MYRFDSHKWLPLPLLPLLALAFLPAAYAQETTAGLQGTVKDSSGAVVPKASVEVTSPALIGNKTVETNQGYYRFANLPPGTYSLTVTASGFSVYKQENIVLEVGHLPTLDVKLEIGTVSQTLEISAQAALIDATQSKVQTNITDASLMNLPTQSLSFQSVIQFAPGARQEPLQAGYQINGASNSENSYLVDGQETANILDGHSSANVPMDFIDEVQVKTSGFEAEYGGALGGVVNVISKRGGNEWHGSLFGYYNADRFNASPNPSLIRNPQFPTNLGAPRLDQPLEYYYPVKDHQRIADPGLTLGGDLIKDRLWIFLGTNPDFNQVRRTVNFTYQQLHLLHTFALGFPGYGKDPAVRLVAVQLQSRDRHILTGRGRHSRPVQFFVNQQPGQLQRRNRLGQPASDLQRGRRYDDQSESGRHHSLRIFLLQH